VIYREKNLAKFERDSNGNLRELRGEQISSKENIIENEKYDIPDFIAYIQAKTELTRGTISQIVLKSNRLDEIFNNPQLFMDNVVRIIKHELDKLKIKGIQYKKIEGQFYEMKLFETSEKEQYIENLIQVKNQAKTLYNYVVVDSLSAREKQFARDCETRDDILFYVKLPRNFSVKTPVGMHNPDWALIKKEAGRETKMYYVVEIKNHKAVKNKNFLSEIDRMKILCAEKHFEVIGKVKYKVVDSVDELDK